ncbi:MAG: hypothetical protein ACJAWC_003244 [Yoonia sp.]|jgi:hypothetical protein
MTVTFGNQPSNYRFDPMDRIYIEGNEARLEYANEAGYVFTHTDGDTLSFNLSRAQVTRLASICYLMKAQVISPRPPFLSRALLNTNAIVKRSRQMNSASGCLRSLVRPDAFVATFVTSCALS